MPSSLPRLILTGPESSGKTSLAKALARHLDGILVEEYLRDYFAINSPLSLEDAIPIARGQWLREEQAAELARVQNSLLICDTDLVSSLVYSAHYYVEEMNTPLWALWENWAERHKKLLKRAPFAPRLYILCGIDWPWHDDGQRDAPDLRRFFHDRFKSELERQGLAHLSVSGSLDERLGAVLAHLVQMHIKHH